MLLTSGTRGSRVNNLRRVGADGAQAGGGGARLQNKMYSIYNEEHWSITEKHLWFYFFPCGRQETNDVFLCIKAVILKYKYRYVESCKSYLTFHILKSFHVWLSRFFTVRSRAVQIHVSFMLGWAFFMSGLTCMCNASSGCSPIRPSVIMTRFPASLDVWEDREEDEWRIEPWRFRGLQGQRQC